MGGKMKSFLNHSCISMLCCLLGTFLTAACSPKFIIQGEMIRGMVVNDDSGKPVAGAAVAIRWLRDPDHRDSNSSTTFKAAQDVSDARGFFKIPVFLNRSYVMGVYKKGYVCWCSKEDFLDDPKVRDPHDAQSRNSPVIEDGLKIRLKPFKEIYSREQHAGFVVLVAGECTDTHSGPFNQAIESEYELWRNNLRKNFQEVFDEKLSMKIKQSP
jgi:hypothetical protein